MAENKLNYLSKLNDMQMQAVLYDGRSLLILAGAGSGKTRVITTRIAYSIDVRGVNPYNILAVTFTNKAAGEMKERAVGLTKPAEFVMIKTFHSFCAWLLRTYSSAAGLNRNFVIYDDEDSAGLVSSILPTGGKKDSSRYAAYIARAKDYLLKPTDDLSSICDEEAFPDVYSAYETRLRQIGNADFGDLIALSVELLKNNETIRNAIHNRFKMLLIDEYQDSNVAQYEFLKQMTGPETKICVVGDDDQSIYRFRGAEVKNILNFQSEFPGTEIIRLEQNYRSCGNILKVASEVIRNNESRLGKELWTKNTDGEKPTICYFQTQDEEAVFCAKKYKENPELSTAILYRSNHLSLNFEKTFAQLGLSFKLVGSIRFYEREEVKDILAFLALFQNPKDIIAFKRIINKPARGLGQAALDSIIDYSSRCENNLILGLELFVAESKPSAKTAGAALFLEFIKNYSNKIEETQLSEFILVLAEFSGLSAYYRELDKAAGTTKAQNLMEMCNLAIDYGSGNAALESFLEDIQLNSGKDNQNTSEETNLFLITMHNTKGLEFDRVIITGMENTIFPSARSILKEDLEEERRLFYVALTRARQELWLTSCANRRVHGRYQVLSPSPFLMELSEGFIRIEGKNIAMDPKFKPGTRVYHDDYGSGFVFRQNIEGDVEVVTVKFETGKVMKFIPKYQNNLEVIGKGDW